MRTRPLCPPAGVRRASQRAATRLQIGRQLSLSVHRPPSHPHLGTGAAVLACAGLRLLPASGGRAAQMERARLDRPIRKSRRHCGRLALVYDLVAMKLLVVSHKPCWPSDRSASGYATDGGLPFQMRAITELFDSTTVMVPCVLPGNREGETPLEGPGLSVL